MTRHFGSGRGAWPVALVLARSATDNGRRTRLDDVIESLGYTREQLEAMDEPQ